MSLYVNLRFALKSIKNNRRRSMLTMIGIIIGIASVITILAIGKGYERDTIKNLTKSNSNNVEMRVSFIPDDNTLYYTNTKFFQDGDLAVLRDIEGIKTVDYSRFSEDQIYKDLIFKEKKISERVKLVDFDREVVSHGRRITHQDNVLLNKVVMIDLDTAKEMFSSAENAIGKCLEFDQQLFKIIGIFPEASQKDLFSLSDVKVKIPKKTYYYYCKHEKDTSSLTLTLKENVNTDKLTTIVVNKLKKLGSLRYLGDYEIVDEAVFTKGIGKILSSITYFVTAVAGISLFIAGVGVMNMMYISISERTKEIGIRRALGASRKSIRMQFLFEGLILTVLGGLVGYLLGMFFAYIVGNLIHVHVTVDLFIILIAIGISSIVGLVFSIVPASNAAKKDLIDILR